MVAHVVEALALFPDALGGGPELAAEVAADGALQSDESVVAELVGETHHGGGAGVGFVREVGHRAEPDDLR